MHVAKAEIQSSFAELQITPSKSKAKRRSFLSFFFLFRSKSSLKEEKREGELVIVESKRNEDGDPEGELWKKEFGDKNGNEDRDEEGDEDRKKEGDKDRY